MLSLGVEPLRLRAGPRRPEMALKRVTIDNAWVQGDPEILNALAGRQALRAKSKQPK
jgi:hypothetical protein